jgi:hypothetical protein
VSGLRAGGQRFAADDGSADPQVAAALADFSRGGGSEHAALMSLARSRLLVPIVAAVASDPDAAGEMSLPTLVGHDGRRAIPAFTCIDTLRGWHQDARPVPTEAGDVWRAAAADDCAVVVDLAGPVPLAIDGARLAALARGGQVPLPHADPDVLTVVRAAAAGLAAVRGLSLDDGGADCDMVIRLRLAAGCTAVVAQETAGAVAVAALARLGGRLRRGISMAVEVEPPPAGQ